MTEPYVDPKTEPLPLRTAPPATYRLDLLVRKIRKGGFPEMAERLDTQPIGTVMWEVADECLNTLIRDREAAAAMYSARVRLELGVEDKPQACSVCGEPDHSADWKLAAREEPEWTWARLYARLDAALLEHKRTRGDAEANDKLWATYEAIDRDVFGSPAREDTERPLTYSELEEERDRLARELYEAQERLCGAVSASGPNGEPLACAYLPDHAGAHSWATLPTYTRDTGRAEIERWLELQIRLTESQVAGLPDDLPGKPMSPARASYAGVAYGLKLALEYSRNGLATVTLTTSVLLLPCGRVIGTEAPMPDGTTVCSCGQVHPRQETAEIAMPWLGAGRAADRDPLGPGAWK